MISEDVVVKSIKQSLEMLRSRIKTLMPTTLCHIGETVVHDARQIHASCYVNLQEKKKILPWSGTLHRPMYF